MNLQKFLNEKADAYDQPFFIDKDPVCIPHMFSQKQDIEISGFFAAIFSWGNRTTIINKSKELMELMDNAPYAFCTQHEDSDLKKLTGFRHRTFNATDLLYFISFFKNHYEFHDSLEQAFTSGLKNEDGDIKESLSMFHRYFFSLEDSPLRTRKHISTPEKKSTCKRLCMFLRWMVRRNSQVDFGIWKNIRPDQLVIPLDVHVVRVARHFQLIKRTATDWQTAVELTKTLKQFDAEDPVKFDFALFALGVLEKY